MVMRYTAKYSNKKAIMLLFRRKVIKQGTAGAEIDCEVFGPGSVAEAPAAADVE